MSIPGVLYQRSTSEQAWRARGRAPLETTTPVDPDPVDPDPPVTPTGPTALRLNGGPSRLRPGESVLDNKPATTPLINAASYSSTRDLTDLMHLIDDTAPAAGTVQLGPGVYEITKMRSYSATDKRGFTNAKRKVLGFVGTVDSFGQLLTKIRMSPTMMSSTPGAVDAVLNATKSAPSAPIAIYMSDSGAVHPFFFSGIRFQGTLQTPYQVYPNAAAQGISRNQTAPSPIVVQGLALWVSQPGSIVQYCTFEGFGFSATTAPPFEAGAVSSNRGNGLVRRRCEIDGRIAAEIDPSRPRASGGWMQNKEDLQTVIDCWDHHFRNSGYATNSNTKNTAERYIATNYLVEEIANGLDGWVSDGTSTLPPGFAGSNVEGIVGTFTYTNVHFNTFRGSHINWAIPYAGGSPVSPYVLPNRAVIIVRGFTTDDTEFGGLLRIATPRQPNSTGISPVWTAMEADFAGATDRLFDIRRADGVRLQPVKYSVYVTNPGAYSPSTHYLLRSL